jgi:hypothetical protein
VTLQLQHILNYGTSTAAVARTMIQGQPIIQPLQVTEERRQDALNVLGDLMKTLLRCVEIHEQIAGAVGVAHAQLEAGTLVLRPQPYTLRPPSIPDLDNKAESFAQAAKLAIAHATRLTVPFYDQDFGHKLNRMASWAADEYRADHRLVQFARHWEPWVKEVLAMRDAVDHPSDAPRGRLHVRNFFVEEHQDRLELFDPRWRLEGEEMQPMAETMGDIIEGVVQLQEDLLVLIFYEFRPNDAFVLQEIPLGQRASASPVRWRVDLSEELKQKLTGNEFL